MRSRVDLDSRRFLGTSARIRGAAFLWRRYLYTCFAGKHECDVDVMFLTRSEYGACRQDMCAGGSEYANHE